MKSSEVNQKDKSIDEILNNIKDVIANSNPDTNVLDLMDIVDDPANDTATIKSMPSEPEIILSSARSEEDAKFVMDDMINKVISNTAESVTKKEVDVSDILSKLDLIPQSNDGAPGVMDNKKAQDDIIPSIVSPKERENHDASLLAAEVISQSKHALQSIIKDEKPIITDSLKLKNGNTVEDLIIELLRPELSVWLNKNLPGIVTSIVQREIKKIIPKDE